MKKEKNLVEDADRREFFQVAAKVAVALPWLWSSSTLLATPDEAKAAIDALVSGKELKNDLITLTVPKVVDDGRRVKIEVKVNSPMTPADHVKDIHIISDGNPFPETVSFTFGSDAGKAELSFYSRMAKTQKTYAVARMSDGSIQMVSHHSDVTAGGCN